MSRQIAFALTVLVVAMIATMVVLPVFAQATAYNPQREVENWQRQQQIEKGVQQRLDAEHNAWMAAVEAVSPAK